MSSAHINSSIALLQHSPAGGSAPIDPEVLAELRSYFDENASESFNDLLGLFMRHLDRRVDAIRVAIKRGDSKAMAAAAHVLKGSSLLIGARSMAEMCSRIELASHSAVKVDAHAVLTLLEDEAGRVRQALEALLSKEDQTMNSGPHDTPGVRGEQAPKATR